ncbi:MAG: hypothetical protein PVF47_01400 [Anaerolineae bacterium]|jgi:uncharacterized protein
MLPEALLRRVRGEFGLDLEGLHGEAHWARVRENGRRLAELTGADPLIVEYFAYLHDCQRQNDGFDREHGRRAAAFAEGLEPSLLPLSGRRRQLLIYACAYHSDGLTQAPLSVQVCWDSDRLDLGRIHIEPDPTYLCTAAARDPALIEWALRRSQQA